MLARSAARHPPSHFARLVRRPIVTCSYIEAFVLALGLVGCGHPEAGRIAPEPTSSPARRPVSAATAGALPEPPSSPSSPQHSSGLRTVSPALEAAPFDRIEVARGEYAWVAAPTGARERRPVVVGVHGAGDRADWSCAAWREVTAEHAFVVCPESGVAHPKWPNTFVWGSATAIGAQAERAVNAVRARYGDWMAEGPLTYGGWSQGGTLASQVLAERHGEYDRVVLVEVGHTPLDGDAVAASFAAAGVRRAVVACESANCRSFAQKFDRATRRRHLSARLSDAGLRHHWFDEPVYRAMAPSMVWLVDDDRRFAGLGAAVDARWMTD
jgi:hypothetical protein